MQVVVANAVAQNTFGSLDPSSEIATMLSTKRSLQKRLRNTLDTGADSTASISVKQGAGSDYQITIRAIPIEVGLDDTVLVLTFEDRSALRDVKAMRSNFVANVSHEIRSPLTAISGFVETLQGPAKDDEEARELFLSLMEKEVLRMRNLVRDLLSLSKVEVKERRPPQKTADPNHIILQAQETANAFAQKHGKSLVLDANGTLPKIMGHHDDLVRALINLLENAVVYSRQDGVVYLAAWLDTTSIPNMICISVRDEGEGIPAAEIPRLTERFYRVDKSRSRNAGGTGLGLAIVKHIMARHRGRLDITSTLGQGSEFRMYLPVPKL